MIKKIFLYLFFVVGIISALFLFIAIIFLGQIPSEKELRSCFTTRLYGVYLCPSSKEYIPLAQISDYLEKSVVLTEDSSFWQHNGFDFNELQKSFETNLKKGKFARGGSTISQQLAKNLYLSKEKTLTRKATEALITIKIEKTFSKREILERYLNVVQFGKNLFGVKAAAQFYFKKNPAQLSVVESAFLTFLLPSPEKYSVSFHKKMLTPFARMRLRQIVDRLYEYERISGEEYESARNELARLWNSSNLQPLLPEQIQPNDEESADEDSDDEPEANVDGF